MAISFGSVPDTSVAYRPIFIIGIDDGTSGACPVMYCDIYFAGQYYKTITSYSPYSVGAFGVTTHRFDIQSVAQEFIQTLIYDITSTSPIAVFDVIGGNHYGAELCRCYLRGSTIDAYGVISPEGPVPVQGTADTAPVAGGGQYAGEVQIINASLQATDMQLWISHIGLFQRGYEMVNNGASDIVVHGGYAIYPMSYADKLQLYIRDSAHFPFYVYLLNGASGRAAKWTVVMVGANNRQVFRGSNGVIRTYIQRGIYTVPIGFDNILNTVPGITDAMINDTEYYFVFLDFQEGGIFNHQGFISPRIYLQHNDAVSPAYASYPANQVSQVVPGHTSLWFQNYQGQLDVLNFTERTETVKVTSTPTERPLVEGGALNVQSDIYTSMGRNNVRSNHVSVVTGLFQEDDMMMVKQLIASSRVFVAFNALNAAGFGTTPPVKMMPVVVVDDSIDTLVFDGRYEYRVTLKYINSNEEIIVR